MKKLTSLFILSMALSFAASGARAAPPSHTTHVSGSSDMSFGAGVSTMPAFPALNSGTGITGSVSGLIGFTPLDTVQVLLSIPGVNGTFRFGIAGLYKRTILGDSGSGFHVGGGIGLGTTGSFGMGISALGGVHHNLTSHIALAFDGGAVFSITSVAGSSQADFGVGSYSSVLGASVHYLF